MSLHGDGEVLKKAISKSGMSISDISVKMGMSRQGLYKLLERETVSLDQITAIGKIIRHNFEDDFADRFMAVKEPEAEYSTKLSKELKELKETLSIWKEKYFNLLEEHKALQKNQLKKYLKDT